VTGIKEMLQTTNVCRGIEERNRMGLSFLTMRHRIREFFLLLFFSDKDRGSCFHRGTREAATVLRCAPHEQKYSPCPLRVLPFNFDVPWEKKLWWQVT